VHIPDIVYRIVAIWMCYVCGQKLWYGLVERKIAPWRDLLDFYKYVYRRDTAPVGYWIEIGQMIIGLAASLFVAIFGWWHPNTWASADGTDRTCCAWNAMSAF